MAAAGDVQWDQQRHGAVILRLFCDDGGEQMRVGHVCHAMVTIGTPWVEELCDAVYGAIRGQGPQLSELASRAVLRDVQAWVEAYGLYDGVGDADLQLVHGLREVDEHVSPGQLGVYVSSDQHVPCLLQPFYVSLAVFHTGRTGWPHSRCSPRHQSHWTRALSL